MSRFTDQVVLLDSVSAVTTTLAVTAATNVVDWVSHPLVNGDRVDVYNPAPATLPGGLTAGIGYYVVEAAADTFKLSLTSGGSAVDITDTGSGTNLIFKSHVKLMDVSSYDNVVITVDMVEPNEDLGSVFTFLRGSVLDTAPDFLMPQSASNQWDNISLSDIESLGTNIPTMLAGDTGILFDDSIGEMSYRLDVRGLKWLGFVVTRFYNGSLKVVAKINGV